MSNQRLEQLFISYGSYHHNAVYMFSQNRNKWIHIICVPLILGTLFGMVHHIKILELFDKPIPLSAVILVTVLLYFFYFSIPVGIVTAIVYTGVYFAFDYLSIKYPENFVIKCAIVHTVSWILQFIGHGFFEKRKPALLDNITQTLSAPLFVVVEILFYFTMGDFKARVESKIEKNVKAFHSKDNSKTSKAY